MTSAAFDPFAREQADVWGSAPWERVAELNAPSHDRLVRRLAPAPGERWLDVGTGTGAVAIRAAQAGARATGLDLSPALIDTAQRLAVEAGADVAFVVGNAEALPFADASFDVVSSAFGVIFAPDHEAAARELGRVTRPGGRLGLTAIVPQSPGGVTWRVLWKYVPLPDGAGDPLAWGTEDHLERLLGDAFELAHEIVETPPPEPRPVEQVWQFMASSFGPLKSALETLPPERADELKAEYLELMEESQGQPRLYALVVGTRR